MKQRILSILCALALLCSGVSVRATDGADFRYRADADGVTLTAYLGGDASPVIPAAIDGKPVTAIGDGCFRGLLCLQKVRIPEGIERIGDYAFECCGALQKVYFPDSLTAIGAGAFSGCAALTLADLGEGIERIGRGAFLCCSTWTCPRPSRPWGNSRSPTAPVWPGSASAARSSPPCPTARSTAAKP